MRGDAEDFELRCRPGMIAWRPGLLPRHRRAGIFGRFLGGKFFSQRMPMKGWLMTPSKSVERRQISQQRRARVGEINLRPIGLLRTPTRGALLGHAAQPLTRWRSRRSPGELLRHGEEMRLRSPPRSRHAGLPRRRWMMREAGRHVDDADPALLEHDRQRQPSHQGARATRFDVDDAARLRLHHLPEFAHRLAARDAAGWY